MAGLGSLFVQDVAVSAMLRALEADRLAGTYLFVGADGTGPVGEVPTARRSRGRWRRGADGTGAHRSAAEESESLILLVNVLTTVFGWMLDVGESAF